MPFFLSSLFDSPALGIAGNQESGNKVLKIGVLAFWGIFKVLPLVIFVFYLLALTQLIGDIC